MPFKGWRFYNPHEASKFIAPPFDAIDSEKFQELMRNRYNIAKITSIEDYGAAADTLKAWFEEGVLVQDKKDCIYLGEDQFTNGDERRIRRFFIALGEMKEGDILPHEDTFENVVDDRLQLLKATKADIGQTLVFYDEKRGRFSIDSLIEEYNLRTRPTFSFSDSDDVLHRLWVVDDSEIVKFIQECMTSKKVVIADGHHRYKAALQYMKESPGNESARYKMMTFVNMKSDSLVAYPFHRVLHSLNGLKTITRKIDKYFRIPEIFKKNGPITEKYLQKYDFLVYYGDKFYCLELNETGLKSTQNNQLTINIMNNLILKNIPEKNLICMADQDQIIKMMQDNPKYQLAFFLKPPTIEEIYTRALEGETLPEKTTCFHPKIPSGLVINKH